MIPSHSKKSLLPLYLHYICVTENGDTPSSTKQKELSFASYAKYRHGEAISTRDQRVHLVFLVFLIEETSSTIHSW
ncbi:hypothetical protein CEXT_438901 [Caerostris extrusa]|uniref:Uncharacterized protein n=1 Tax=Caerostris extrusa TaxID=172846 RepID=A0AAV4N598_CAEEX|nr:hypothetical protein CEXT_438901 [Caerostris extrusa]